MSDNKASERLKQNLCDQVERCLCQLKDLDTSRDEMSDQDYEEQYEDTLQQLKEVHHSLEKIQSGDLALLDHISSIQLAISAAISRAFHTPEILGLFAARQPDQLRERLAMVERDRKINQMSDEKYKQEKCEILSALLKLRAPLTDQQHLFLTQNTSQHLAHFVGTDDAQSTANSNRILHLASSSLSSS